eukprot:6492395-Amphidinium_carterae.2
MIPAKTVEGMVHAVMPSLHVVASKSTKATSVPSPLRVLSGQAVGAELTVSTGRYGSADPAVCGHPNQQLKPRANAKTKWWTCLACGMRFQRFQWQDQPPHAQEKMGMGRHRDLSFEEIPDDYAQWAIREYEANGESMHPQLLRFCLWRISQEQTESVRLPTSPAALPLTAHSAALPLTAHSAAALPLTAHSAPPIFAMSPRVPRVRSLQKAQASRSSQEGDVAAVTQPVSHRTQR